MVHTLDALTAHLTKRRAAPCARSSGHNTHIDDSGATEMRPRAEVNVGQLVRDSHAGQSTLIGFTLYTGDRDRRR